MHHLGKTEEHHHLESWMGLGVRKFKIDELLYIDVMTMDYGYIYNIHMYVLHVIYYICIYSIDVGHIHMLTATT